MAIAALQRHLKHAALVRYGLSVIGAMPAKTIAKKETVEAGAHHLHRLSQKENAALLSRLKDVVMTVRYGLLVIGAMPAKTTAKKETVETGAQAKLAKQVMMKTLNGLLSM